MRRKEEGAASHWPKGKTGFPQRHRTMNIEQSSEIRNALTVWIGRVQLARRRQPDDWDLIASDLSEVEAAGWGMLAIVEQLEREAGIGATNVMAVP